MIRSSIGTAGLALLLLAGCGGEQERAGQPSADESEKLDNIAGKLENGTYDTSPDSLVPAEEEDGAANAAAPAPAPEAPVAANNQAAPGN